MGKDYHIRAHFQKHDPVLFSIIASEPIDLIVPQSPSTYFVSLCRTIIGQQLSTTVAEVIFLRFEALFHSKVVTPNAVLDISDEELRRIGLSGAKVRFVKDAAEKVIGGEVDVSSLTYLSDGDVMKKLITIKGVGSWTAEMFCMFALGREDVFSFGDLGLKRAIQKLYALKKEPSEYTMKRLTKAWKPYRTYAAFALWSYLDTSKIR